MTDNKLTPHEVSFIFFVVISICLIGFTIIYCFANPVEPYFKTEKYKTIQIEGCDYIAIEYCDNDGCIIDNQLENVKLKPNGNCGNVKAK